MKSIVKYIDSILVEEVFNPLPPEINEEGMEQGKIVSIFKENLTTSGNTKVLVEGTGRSNFLLKFGSGTSFSLQRKSMRELILFLIKVEKEH